MDELKSYYTVSEIANQMHIKTSMIYSLIKQGRLKCVRVGAKYLISADAVLECFDNLKVN